VSPLKVSIKGFTLGDISTIAIVIVVAGVALGIGSVVMQDIQVDVRTPTLSGNETVTMSSYAGTLAHGYVIGELTECWNDTVDDADHDAILLEIPGQCNVTTENTNQAGTVTMTGGNQSSSDHINVSYTYDAFGIASQAAMNATVGLGEVASWLPTIALVIAAALIIGIVFSSFMKGKV